MNNGNLPPQPGQGVPPQPSAGQQIQIRFDNKDLKGHYSNLVQVNSTKEEFALDFLSLNPPIGVLAARIYMSPPHVKRMAKLLNTLISQYEQKFGQIAEAEPVASPPNIGFQSPTNQ